MGIKKKMKKAIRKIDKKLDKWSAKLDCKIAEDELFDRISKLNESASNNNREELLVELIIINAEAFAAVELFVEKEEKILFDLVAEYETASKQFIGEHPELTLEYELMEAMMSKLTPPVSDSKEAQIDYLRRAEMSLRVWATRHITKDEFKGILAAARMNIRVAYHELKEEEVC